MNVLTPYQKGTVLTLLQNEVSHREICRKTGIDRKTIRKLARTMVTLPVAAEPNSPTPATGSPSPPGQIPPPRPPAFGAAAPACAPLVAPAHARSACEPHREWIEAQVHLGRNAMAIYQELVDERGFTLRYNSVKRFCRALRQREPEQFDRLEFLSFALALATATATAGAADNSLHGPAYAAALRPSVSGKRSRHYESTFS